MNNVLLNKTFPLIALCRKIWYYIFMNKIYILPINTDAYEFIKEKACKKHNIDINTLEIKRNEHGKPYFKNLPDFHFNISHSTDILAVAISDGKVGIDIEKLRTPDLRIAKRFCEDEQAYVTETDPKNRFFEVWTKKEAYLKYKGTGISGGLNSFSIFNTEIPLKTFKISDYIMSVCSKNCFEIIKT